MRVTVNTHDGKHRDFENVKAVHSGNEKVIVDFGEYETTVENVRFTHVYED